MCRRQNRRFNGVKIDEIAAVLTGANSQASLAEAADPEGRIFSRFWEEGEHEIQCGYLPMMRCEKQERHSGREDYAAAMEAGVVCRRLRSVRDGNENRVVEEYEINTALIESMNSVKRRAAIETGQEVDRQDIHLGAKTGAREALLAKAFTAQELEAMRAWMLAVVEAEERGDVVTTPSSHKPAVGRRGGY